MTSATIDYKFTFKPNTTVLDSKQLEIARKIATAANSPIDTVTALRVAGMGWGTIARQLGVRPDMIGLKYGDGSDEFKNRPNEKSLLRGAGIGDCG